MLIENRPGIAPWALRMEQQLGSTGSAAVGHVLQGESLAARAARWKAEIRAAKGRKPEAKAEEMAAPASEPEVSEYVPGALLTESRAMAAALVAARRLSRLNSFTETHKLPVYRA